MLMLDTLIEALIFSEWYHCSQRIVSASAENNQPEGDMPCEYRRNCLYGERNPYVCGGNTAFCWMSSQLKAPLISSNAFADALIAHGSPKMLRSCFSL
ncbi:uncharacterized protein LOC109724963 isoform X2 [Ananas comosus]|uniref:Uncharacterized protein LOC109724963 isoform X2 n=1 Tax=Ananas comosus TaxID=4615 RepID=A0A6P5GP46_ANACO|nr:uncharacterized protein LOC109724963 isoform X2 [Ananas comosus]